MWTFEILNYERDDLLGLPRPIALHRVLESLDRQVEPRSNIITLEVEVCLFHATLEWETVGV